MTVSAPVVREPVLRLAASGILTLSVAVVRVPVALFAANMALVESVACVLEPVSDTAWRLLIAMNGTAVAPEPVMKLAWSATDSDRLVAVFEPAVDAAARGIATVSAAAVFEPVALVALSATPLPPLAAL